MTQIFANNAAGETAQAISTIDTVVTLKPGQGAFFPNPGAGNHTVAVLQNAAVWEIVHITSRAGDALTVVRAQDGTVGANFPIGTTVELRVTRGTFANFLQLTGGAVGPLQVTSPLTVLHTTGNAEISIRKPVGTWNNMLYGRVGPSALGRWGIILGNADAESTGHAGSNFELQRLKDDGTWLGTPINITRSTGNITFEQNLQLNGSGGVFVNGDVTTDPGDVEKKFTVTNMIWANPEWDNITFRAVHKPSPAVGNYAGAEILVGSGSSVQVFRFRNDGFFITPSLATVNFSTGSIAATGNVEIDGTLGVDSATRLRSTTYFTGDDSFFIARDAPSDYRVLQFEANTYISKMGGGAHLHVHAGNAGELRLQSDNKVAIDGPLYVSDMHAPDGTIEVNSEMYHHAAVVMLENGNLSQPIYFKATGAGFAGRINGYHNPGVITGVEIFVSQNSKAWVFGSDGVLHYPSGLFGATTADIDAAIAPIANIDARLQIAEHGLTTVGQLEATLSIMQNTINAQETAIAGLLRELHFLKGRVTRLEFNNP